MARCDHPAEGKPITRGADSTLALKPAVVAFDPDHVPPVQADQHVAAVAVGVEKCITDPDPTGVSTPHRLKCDRRGQAALRGLPRGHR